MASPPTINGGAQLLPVSIAVDPDETAMNLVVTGGSGAYVIVVLGSFTDRTVSLSPPLGIPPSASQLTSQSAVAPSLDRAVWTARADCPRYRVDNIFTARGTLIPAPGRPYD
jgi:hypothetical protein